MRSSTVVLACLVSLAFGAAPSFAARATTVQIPLPSPGDASYGVVQVKTGKKLKAFPPKGARVLRETVGGLKVEARATGWKALRKTTKVYVGSWTVANVGGSVRNVAFFISRPKGAKG